MGRFQAIIGLFRINPANAILFLIIEAAAILLSLMLHECGHGISAYWCGDPTAKMMGRITLNPAKHLDPIGTIMMLLVGFGWANPVPIDPRNFKNRRRDYIFVSSAGIIVNILLFLLFLAFSVILNQFLWIDLIPQSNNLLPVGTSGRLIDFSKNGYFYDLSELLVYNGDFSNIGMYCKAPALIYLQFFFQTMARLNISLAVFNLLPIPPMMDGWRILDGAFLRGRVHITPQHYMVIRIVLVALLLTGYLGIGLSYITNAATDGVLHLYRLIGGIA